MATTGRRARRASSARRRRKGGASRGAEFTFDKAAADRACAFFSECLVHVKGRHAGQAFELLPWEEKVVRDLFGWKRRNGTRRYRTAFIEIPRKNGKSTLAAGLALILAFADGEVGAEVYSAAADRDQAAIVYETGRRMVEISRSLHHGVFPGIEIWRRSMVHPTNGQTWKVLSADAPTKHGLNAHGIIFDELHAQPNRELWDVLTTSTGSREQPLTIAITTAGYDRQSICWEVYEYAKKVEAGVLEDPSFYSCIFEAGDDADWTDEAIWEKANPSLDVALDRDYLRDQCRKAQASPAAQNAFRRLHLNQWTRQRDRWLDLAKWDECAGALMPAEIEAANEGRVAYAGLDLASTTDLCALLLIFPPEEDADPGLYDVIARFWVPDANARVRELRDRVPYVAWAREGWITLTEGNVVDYGVIRQELLALSNRYEIREVAFDRWGAQKLSNELTDDGLTMVQFGQGMASMSPPTKELLHLVLQHRIRHGGHPVLRWNADNLVVRTDPAGNVKPDKGKSTEKIDGMVALVMALDRAVRLEGGEPGSVYEERGIQTL